MASCVVSYVDSSGIRHSVEVQADGLYEAAVLGVRALREHDCEPGEVRPIEIEVRKSVIHTLTLRRVQEYLNGASQESERKSD